MAQAGSQPSTDTHTHTHTSKGTHRQVTAGQEAGLGSVTLSQNQATPFSTGKKHKRFEAVKPSVEKGQRNLAAYSPWGHQEWARLKRLGTHSQPPPRQ